MSEPDMTNKLALRRRENVNFFLREMNIDRHMLHDLSGVSVATIGMAFFGSVQKQSPSKKTMQKICDVFDLPENYFDGEGIVLDFMNKPEIKTLKQREVAVELPQVIEQTPVTIKIGKTTIDTEVDTVIAERILKLLVLGDDI